MKNKNILQLISEKIDFLLSEKVNLNIRRQDISTHSLNNMSGRYSNIYTNIDSKYHVEDRTLALYEKIIDEHIKLGKVEIKNDFKILRNIIDKSKKDLKTKKEHAFDRMRINENLVDMYNSSLMNVIGVVTKIDTLYTKASLTLISKDSYPIWGEYINDEYHELVSNTLRDKVEVLKSINFYKDKNTYDDAITKLNGINKLEQVVLDSMDLTNKSVYPTNGKDMPISVYKLLDSTTKENINKKSKHKTL